MGSMGSYSGVSVEPPSRCAACLKVTRQVISFLLSHIGLLSLVVGYCIMGAAIFEEIEKDNEIATKRNMTKTRLAVSDSLWEITREMEVLHEANWTRQVTDTLKRFEKQLIIALKEKGWDGKEEEDTVTWSFTGALFYSITVITTIGYGHIAPKTAVGKIVTIFYAIVGMPLTVLCWSNIGAAMANAFRFTYWKICCYVYVKKSRKRRRRILSRQRGMSMRQPVLNRHRSTRRPQRPSQRSADSKATSNTMDSRASAMPTQSQFILGEIPPEQDGSMTSTNLDRYDDNERKQQPETLTTPVKSSGRKLTNLSINISDGQSSFPPSPTSPAALDPPALEYLGPHYQNQLLESSRVSRAILRADRESQKSQYSAGGSSGSPVPNTLPVPRGHQQRIARLPEDNWTDDQSYYEEYYYEESELDDHDDISRRPVPILLCVLLVIAYNVAGAFLFQMWEGWSFLDSLYFCFITLTTIGFGDLTPDQKNEDGEQRIVLCSIYLLFGIAMIAMSFNLVQEEVINSVKSVGKILGILKDDDEEDENY